MKADESLDEAVPAWIFAVTMLPFGVYVGFLGTAGLLF
jgi:hypothetical protein